MVKKKPQTEKKKPGVYRRILKWIYLTALSVLIILSLIFQAPWKIITLLLIILAACTVLPKPARKWFWLSVAAIVLVLIIWVFLPTDNEGWQPYTFDEEFAALEAKYAIPDSENAAIIYNDLFDDYDPNTMRADSLDPNIDNLIRREPWSSRDYPEIAKWLKDNQNTIAILLQASKIQNCRFPIYADPANVSLPAGFLSVMRRWALRRWAFLLTIAANNDLGEGRTNEALEKYTAVLQMGNHHCQQPTMINLMVGIAIEALALGRLETFVVTADATEEHLNIIEKALAGIKHDWTTDWPRILDYEKLIPKSEFARYYDVNPRGKIRLSRDPLAQLRACWKEQLESNQKESQQIREYLESHVDLNYWQKKLIKAKTILYWFYIPSSPQGASKLIETCYKRYYAMAEPDFDWQKEPKKFYLISLKLNYHFISQSLVVTETIYYRFHDLYFRTIAEQRGAGVLIALRRYKNKTGQWPQKLDEVKSLAPAEIFVDPINGGSFVYKLTEENFTLYSKGKNNIDENGEYRSNWPEKAGPDDWLIWPTKTRKTKNEKADSK